MNGWHTERNAKQTQLQPITSIKIINKQKKKGNNKGLINIDIYFVIRFLLNASLTLNIDNLSKI